MKKHLLVLSVLIVLLLAAFAPLANDPPPPPPQTPPAPPAAAPTVTAVTIDLNAFPIAKGAVWSYQGTAKWQDEAGQEAQAEIAWTMAVTDMIDRGPVKGYLVNGYLSDLNFYEPGVTPTDHILVQVGPKWYDSSNMDIWNRLQDQNDSLIDLVSEAGLILDLPLWPDKFFGETAQLTRLDGMYRWQVEAAEAALAAEDNPAAEPQMQYTLAYRTNPDAQIITFAPGVGITAYQYQHHGTISDVQVELVEFTPGQAETPATGMSNPASVNCIDQGGSLTIEKRGDGGEFGVCWFADGLQCEEWALMYGDCPAGGLKVTGYGPQGRYCVITGGEYTDTGSTADAEQGNCAFKNGVTCDGADYFNGLCGPNQ
jgi:putative hemolysin